jgi:hypothetical protein
MMRTRGVAVSVSLWISFSLSLLIVGFAAACGGSTRDGSAPASGDDDDDDAGSVVVGFGDDDSDADVGPVSPGLPELDASYPAVKPPDIAQITFNTGGKVLSTPRMVTVVWKSDPNLAQIEAFAGALGGSSYWQTVTSEYGVGAATNENYEIEGDPPSSLSDADLDSMVQSNVASGTWPAFTDQTMYMVYIPESVSFQIVTSSGKLTDGCPTEVGYHSETNYGSESGPYYPYGIIPEKCAEGDPTVPTLVASVTATAAHEIIETATDPLPDEAPGWVFFDAAHFSYELYNDEADEIADACELEFASYYQEGADLPFYVQRIWSNASALAGTNPCVPVVSGQPYYNVSIVDPEMVTVTAADGTRNTAEGYRIPQGTSRSIPLLFYSDVPTDGGWFLDAIEGNLTDPVSPSRLTVHVDTPQGVNGQSGSVTVTVNSVGATTAQLITLRSRRGDEPHHFIPILIGAY